MDIAIIGIGCRFPGGVRTPDEFWELLRNGVDAITEIPVDRFDLSARFDPDPTKEGKLHTRWGGFLDRVDAFDAEFFGISPREARRIDPQQRLLLEVAWEALEDAGQPADLLAGSSTGVFVGISSNDYGQLQLQPGNAHLIDAYTPVGGALSVAANRVSYSLDLRGPSIAIDTACSSSLTALHLASQSLGRGECGLGIVGGVNVLLKPEVSIGFGKASMLSPDGHCKPFDANANGYVRSEGAGAVVLKPLQAALTNRDPIYAVIRATAINQDGRTPGISVPNAAAQKALLLDALSEAGIAPAEVQYVEAHGTGTAAGDPREADAIGSVYSRDRSRDQPCLMGSVKSNLGHLEAGAGVAGLIKAALALKHRMIPPNLHFNQPSPAIPFDKLNVSVPTTLQPWPAPAGHAAAGVNSFGFGGANAHVILSEAPSSETRCRLDDGAAQVLTISARSPGALRELAGRFSALLADDNAPSLRDVCHTAALRRSHHEYRLAAVSASPSELSQRLEAYATDGPVGDVAVGRYVKGLEPKLAFVFSGMGPQWWGMGRQLLRKEPIFRGAVEECDEILREFVDWSLIEELANDEATSRVAEADVAHVANFALQVGLASLWRSWGVVPDAVVGHSSGEMAAAHVAGVVPLRDAVYLAYQRGRLQHLTTGTGGMIAVGLSVDVLADLIGAHQDRVSVAAINSPRSVTLAGDLQTLAKIGESLGRQGHFWRWLPVRVPYHGPQMDSLREEFREVLAGLDCRCPTVPIVSTVTGDSKSEQMFDAEYWWRNVRQPVRFAPAIDRLVNDGYRLFLELSPHPVLGQSILECVAEHPADHTVVLPSLRRHEDDRRTMLRSLAGLYVHGRPIDWESALGAPGNYVRLPTYPWQHERYWFKSVEDDKEDDGPIGVYSGHPLLGRRLRGARPTWEIDLADGRLAYLEDHALSERPAFAGAAYVETMLAASAALRGRNQSPLALEEVRFERLLPLHDRKDRLLQTLVDGRGERVEIHSTTKGGDGSWTRHAAARLREARPGQITASVDLQAIRQRCPNRVAVDEFYASAARRGLHYAGAFRGIAELWQGRGEAIGRIVFPEDSTLSTDEYRVHPALLDSAIQSLDVALTTREGQVLRKKGALVVTDIGRVTAHAPIGELFWCHSVLKRVDGNAAEGCVQLIDDAGNTLLACENVRLKVFEERGLDIADLMWEEVWERAARPVSASSHSAVSSAPEIARVAQPLVDRFVAETGFGDYYDRIESALNTMAVRSIRTALTQIGWSWQDRKGSADQLGIASQHRRFFTRLVEIAQTTTEDERFDNPDLAERDDVDLAVRLVRESGGRLGATLRGEEDARRWLVAGDASQLLADFYTRAVCCLFYNRTVAEIVAAAGRSGRKLRILDVGAGIGATAAAILDRVPDAVAEYVFTDVSPFFVKRARERFKSSPNVRFEVLDIEEEPTLSEPGFDIVVAADVVHATANVNVTLDHLRRLLAPGGLLVLLELARRSPWVDLVFGQFDGWWRFEDHRVRPSHPLLGASQWPSLLGTAGFEQHAVIADSPEDGGEPAQAIVVAQAPKVALQPTRSRASQRRWLIFADRRGIGEKVAVGLRARGDCCTLIRPGKRYERRDPDQIELVPTDPEHWQRLLQELAEQDRSPLCLIHLWSGDAPLPQDLTAPFLMDFQDLICGSIVCLMQATQGGRGIDEVCLVTFGAQAVEADPVRNPAPGSLWGLGRVLRNELGGRRCRLIDLSANCGSDELNALLAEITNDPRESEPELALRGSDRYIRRLQRASLDRIPTSKVGRPTDLETTSFRLEVGLPGTLDSLALRELDRAPQEAGEVTIRVRAAGLNFHDVLQALGMLGSDADVEPLGLECAGVVTSVTGTDSFRPGDEVIAVATGAFASEVTARADVVFPKPAQLSFEEAATVPIAFTTAHHALRELARITAGERVLLHSASGGVGLAAVQLCRQSGATIFATAGTPQKRAYLESIGIEHVMDSRSIAFADEVLDLTDGDGVDVVLNSLAGDARTKGLALLRPGGRFIEMGVRDILSDLPLGLRPFEKGLSFFTLGHTSPAERPGFAATLRSVLDEFAAGSLEPLPHTDFDLGKAEQAFRLMAEARHVGKIVLTVREPSYLVTPKESSIVRQDATYLIAGGLGGFGLAVAHWLVVSGAQHIVLTSQTGVPREQDRPALDALLQTGAEVVVKRSDVVDPSEVNRLFAGMRAEMPPLKGIIHAAMMLDDDLLGRLDLARFRAVLAPKVAGAWNLHSLSLNEELDFFVGFSSGSSLFGIPSQGNYAAANAFLDTLAHYRRSLELPGLAVNWGPIGGVGYLVRHPDLQIRRWWEGVGSISADQACAALDRSLHRDLPQVAVAHIDSDQLMADKTNGSASSVSSSPRVATNADDKDGIHKVLSAQQRDVSPAERRVLFERTVIQHTAKVLQTDIASVDPARSLTDMGLDSLMAVELQAGLQRDLGVELSLVEVLGGQSLHDLMVGLLEQASLDGSLN